MTTLFIAAYLTVAFAATFVVLALNGASGAEWLKLFLSPVMLPIIAAYFAADRLRRWRNSR